MSELTKLQSKINKNCKIKETLQNNKTYSNHNNQNVKKKYSQH